MGNQVRTLLLVICCASCQQDSPKAFYEIKTGKEVQFQLTSYKNEPYYWQWANQENTTHLKLSSRVYAETTFSTPKRPRGSEKWTFEGIATGTDTLKLFLQAYEEDSLNIPVVDSVIITVKVN